MECIRNFPLLSDVEQRKTKNSPCTLCITLSTDRLKARNGAPYRYTMQNRYYFRLVPLFFVIRRLLSVGKRRTEEAVLQAPRRDVSWEVVDFEMAQEYAPRAYGLVHR